MLLQRAGRRSTRLPSSADARQPADLVACVFCQAHALDAPSTGALRGLLFVVSIVALVVSIAALATAVRAWQKSRSALQTRAGRGTSFDSGTALAETGEGRTRFI
jgi:hypothetical protein